jgi:hypothetical protein
MFDFDGPECRDIEIMQRIDANDPATALLLEERKSRSRFRVAGVIHPASPRLAYVIQAFDNLHEMGVEHCVAYSVDAADEALTRGVDVAVVIAEKEYGNILTGNVSHSTCGIL